MPQPHSVLHLCSQSCEELGEAVPPPALCPSLSEPLIEKGESCICASQYAEPAAVFGFKFSWKRKKLLANSPAIHVEWELQAACWSCSLQVVTLSPDQLKKVKLLNLRFFWILTYWCNWDFSFYFCTFSFPVNDHSQQTNTCFDKVFFVLPATLSVQKILISECSRGVNSFLKITE